MDRALFDPKKNLYIHKRCSQFFENNQIITASRIKPSTHEMTKNERFNMTGVGKIVSIFLPVEVTVKSEYIHDRKTKFSLFELNMSPMHIIAK